MSSEQGKNSLSDDDIERIILWIVSKFTKAFPNVSIEDLVQEGWVAALNAKNTYDSKRAKLSTWVVVNVTGVLKTYIYSGIDESKKRRALEGVSIKCRLPEFIEVVCLKDLLSILKVILSPMAFEVMSYQISTFPSRASKENLSLFFKIGVPDVENLCNEIRYAVKCIQEVT